MAERWADDDVDDDADDDDVDDVDDDVDDVLRRSLTVALGSPPQLITSGGHGRPLSGWVGVSLYRRILFIYHHFISLTGFVSIVIM